MKAMPSFTQNIARLGSPPPAPPPEETLLYVYYRGAYGSGSPVERLLCYSHDPETGAEVGLVGSLDLPGTSGAATPRDMMFQATQDDDGILYFIQKGVGVYDRLYRWEPGVGSGYIEFSTVTSPDTGWTTVGGFVRYGGGMYFITSEPGALHNATGRLYSVSDDLATVTKLGEVTDDGSSGLGVSAPWGGPNSWGAWVYGSSLWTLSTPSFAGSNIYYHVTEFALDGTSGSRHVKVVADTLPEYLPASTTSSHFDLGGYAIVGDKDPNKWGAAMGDPDDGTQAQFWPNAAGAWNPDDVRRVITERGGVAVCLTVATLATDTALLTVAPAAQTASTPDPTISALSLPYKSSAGVNCGAFYACLVPAGA